MCEEVVEGGVGCDVGLGCFGYVDVVVCDEVVDC